MNIHSFLRLFYNKPSGLFKPSKFIYFASEVPAKPEVEETPGKHKFGLAIEDMTEEEIVGGLKKEILSKFVSDDKMGERQAEQIGKLLSQKVEELKKKTRKKDFEGWTVQWEYSISSDTKKIEDEVTLSFIDARGKYVGRGKEKINLTEVITQAYTATTTEIEEASREDREPQGTLVAGEVGIEDSQAEAPAPAPAPAAQPEPEPTPEPDDQEDKPAQFNEKNAVADNKTVTPTKKPREKLTESEFKTLAEKLILEGKDAISIVRNLNDLADKIKRLNIKKITLSVRDEAFEWTQENGFGNKAELIHKILNLKKDQLGEDSPEFKKFLELSKSGSDDEKIKEWEKTHLAKFLETIGKEDLSPLETYFKETPEREVPEEWNQAIRSIPLQMHTQFGDLSEEEIAAQWEKFDGIRDIERIMKLHPFLLDRERIGSIAAKIISEGNNQTISLDDVIESMEGFPNFASANFPRDYLHPRTHFGEIHDGFLSKFATNVSTLEHNAIKKADGSYEPLSEKDRAKLVAETEAMYKEIIVPCLQLMDALIHLKPRKEEEVAEKKVDVTPEVAEEQEKIMEGLRKLFNFRAVDYSEDEAKTLTMTDINGVETNIDRGEFLNNFDPKSALRIFVLLKGDEKEPRSLYSYDENDQMLMDPDEITEEVNRLIALGVAKKAFDLQSGEIADTAAESLYIKDITDFENFTDEQMRAFQDGYIIDQKVKFDLQIEKYMKLAEEKHPELVELKRVLEEEKVPKEFIDTVIQKFIMGGGISVDLTTGTVDGGMLGIPIQLPDGNVLIITASYSSSSPIGATANVTLDIKIYKGDTVEFALPISFGLTNVGIGGRATFTNEEGSKLSIFGGAGVSYWGSVQAYAGILQDDTGKYEKEMHKQIEEAEARSPLSVLWEEWDKEENRDIHKKYELLKKLPEPYKTAVEGWEKQYGLKEADIVNIIDWKRREIKEKGLKEYTFPPVVGGGIVVVVDLDFPIPIPVPVIMFNLGSRIITVPHRKEVSKIIGTLSDYEAEDKLKKAQEKAFAEKGTFRFIEETPNLVYSHTGELLILDPKEKHDVDLSTWNTEVETHNEQLEAAEIELVELENGRVELIIKRPKDISGEIDLKTEVHIDPTLQTLALIKDGGRYFLHGSINDVMITRQRATLPLEHGKTNIRDIITIRQNASLIGERDLPWILDHEGKYLEELPGERSLQIKEGARSRVGLQTNLFEVEGFATGTESEWSEHYGRFTPDQIDQEEIEAKERLVEERRSILGSVDRGSYLGETLRPNLFEELDKLFKQKDFEEKLREITDKPAEIGKLVNKYLDPDLNSREFNVAVLHLINLSFTTLFPDRKKPLTEKDRKELLRRINQRIEYVKDNVLTPLFEDAISRISPPPAYDASTLAQHLIDITYKGILSEISKPGFDVEMLKKAPDKVPFTAMFFSGTRKFVKGDKQGALAQTMEGVEMGSLPPNTEALIQEIGFIAGTRVDIMRGTTDKDKALARVLLEIASPLPKEDQEFLRSPLALKIGALQSHVFLTESDEEYRQITELLADPAKASKPEYQQALTNFKKLVQDIRQAELAGRPFEKKVGTSGLTVRITMTADIVGGAYTKCANPSFYVSEVGKVEILSESRQVIAAYTENIDLLEAELRREQVFFGAALQLKVQPKKVPRIVKDEDDAPNLPDQPEGVKQTGDAPQAAETPQGPGTVDTGHAHVDYK